MDPINREHKVVSGRRQDRAQTWVIAHSTSGSGVRSSRTVANPTKT
jgi:hypothetical protein